MKKILFSILIFTFSISFAQIGSSTQIGSSKWTFGGSLGINGAFGNGGFGLNISPRVGYKISENLEGGVLGSLSWQNSSYSSSTLFGIGPFANYYLGRSFYLSGQFQEFVINQKIKETNQKLGSDEAALFLGGGYLQRFGNNAYMQIGGMYNVLWKENNSIFGSGFIPSFGIVYGL